MADLGFSPGGAPTPKVGVLTNFFGRKLHENKRILTLGGRASLAPPLDPPLVYHKVNEMGGTSDQLKLKVPRSGQIFICGGGALQTNSDSKSQDLPKFSFSEGGCSRSTQSAKICPNFHLGEGVLQTNILEILEWGNSRNYEPKFLATGMCSASQIVSHILRVWGLMIQKILLDFQNFTNDLCLRKILSNFDFFFWPSLFASEIVHFDTFYNFQIATETMN